MLNKIIRNNYIKGAFNSKIDVLFFKKNKYRILNKLII